MPFHHLTKALLLPALATVLSGTTAGGGCIRPPGSTALVAGRALLGSGEPVHSMRYVEVEDPGRYRLLIVAPDGTVTWPMPILGYLQR